MADSPLPKVQRRLSSFVSEERGTISKQSLVSVGSILAATTVLASLAQATHQNEPLPSNPKCRACHNNSVAHSNNIGFGGGGTLEVGHANTEPYHCSHSNCQPPHYK